ncbi:MAG TPA: C40 family peptidase [Clostridiales bacterium]|jgi:hypothetical protein|nr:C40 family peptidase [Clostridiales bacterium]
MLIKRLFSVFLLCCLLAASVSPNALEPQPILEAALSLLESGNPFTYRYNELTNSKVETPYEFGVPYFFGGRDERFLLIQREPWQESPAKFYTPGKIFFYGYDCVGYTRWCLQQAGYTKHASLSTLLNGSSHQAYDLGLSLTPWEKLPKKLKVGDLMVLYHGNSYHVMLYIGTLRDYAYTSDTLGEELAPFIDYPLVAHCSTNPFYYDRYRDYINQLQKRWIQPPDGGVTVSIIGPELSDAPLSKLATWTTRIAIHYFDLDGYPLSVFDTSDMTKHRWYRWDQRPKEAALEGRK